MKRPGIRYMGENIWEEIYGWKYLRGDIWVEIPERRYMVRNT